MRAAKLIYFKNDSLIDGFRLTLRQFRREARAAQEAAESVIGFSVEHGLPELLAWTTPVRGWAIAEEGSHEEGITQIRESLAALRAMGAELGRPYHLSLLAEACMDAARLDDAMSALREALAAANENEERNPEAEIHRLKGKLLLRQGNLNGPEAQKCFERAIEVARKQSAKSRELRATISLARLLEHQGRRDEALAMLAEIYNWFTEGFDTADLKHAKAPLKEFAG